MITEELVDCRVYQKEYVDVTWEQCDLRKWLNETFINEAFNEKERSEITVVCNRNPDNEEYGTKGGNPTWDRVFALSIDEAEKYFRDDMDRRAAVTPYARSQGSDCINSYATADGQPAGWWWLRSPGFYCSDASVVDTGGGVDRFGPLVYGYGVSVRPALWLNL